MAPGALPPRERLGLWAEELFAPFPPLFLFAPYFFLFFFIFYILFIFIYSFYLSPSVPSEAGTDRMAC